MRQNHRTFLRSTALTGGAIAVQGLAGRGAKHLTNLAIAIFGALILRERLGGGRNGTCKTRWRQRDSIYIGEFIRPGGNLLEIVVTNALFNSMVLANRRTFALVRQEILPG